MLAPSSPSGAATPGGFRFVWWQVLVGGLILWLVAGVLATTTDDLEALPIVILAGAALAPLTFVFWTASVTLQIPWSYAMQALGIGALLGVLAVFVIKTPPAGFWGQLGVAAIQEGVKAGALLVLAHCFLSYEKKQLSPLRLGLAIGAALGLGFAAIETTGRALFGLFAWSGATADGVVGNTMLPGAFGPAAQGLWTAAVGGVIFSAVFAGAQFGLTSGVGWAVTGATFLHLGTAVIGGISPEMASWFDGSPTIALALQWLGLMLMIGIGVVWVGALLHGTEETERRRRKHAAREEEIELYGGEL